MALGTRKAGDFCWVNILASRPDEEREFFGSLLDWTYSEMPGMGHLIKVGGENIGGFFDLDGPNTPPGTPPMVGVMIKVENADAAAEKAVALGGKAGAAFDVAESGRMSVLSDPAGAHFDVWEPKRMPATAVDSRLHGAPSWFHGMSRESDKAVPFYREMFGWTSVTVPIAGTEDTTFSLDGERIAGLMQITPNMGTFPSHWGTYSTVDDADATLKLASELGGTVFIPVMPIPGIGRFCGLLSPQGVRFYAIEYSA